MRALVYDRYGALDVLTLREMSTPTVKSGEVLVRVRAAALNPKDSFVRKGRFKLISGRSFPKQVGADLAGEVVESEVAAFPPGTRVFGMLDEWTYKRGTVAEYVAVQPREIGVMPSSLSFTQAAALPLVGLTALQALRDVAQVRAGDAVCIHGASGGVGTAAIQIAVALGAVVTTTSSARNLDLCRSLGATTALDYVTDAPWDRHYRVVLDAFGNQSLGEVRRALAKDGSYVTTVPSLRIVRDALRTATTRPRARLVVVRPRTVDLDTLAGFVRASLLKPVIDRVVALDDVIEGMRHVETKRTRGKVVVSIVPD